MGCYRLRTALLKRWRVITTLLLSSCLTVTVAVLPTDPDDPASYPYSEALDMCQRPWRPVLKVLQNGTVLHGSVDQLRALTLTSNMFRIKLYRPDGPYILNVDNTNVKGEHVCAESMWHVSDNGTHISTNAEWRYHLLCTNGKVWIVNSPYSRPDQWSLPTNASLSERLVDATANFGTLTGDSLSMVWYVKKTGNGKLVYAHFLDGSRVSGTLTDLIYMAERGETRGVMRDRGYSFLMNSVVIDKTANEINGQSIGHVGQDFTVDALTFKLAPYHWYSSWTTSGRRDNTRWLVGTTQPRGHNNDYVALDWHVDSCWREVYVNTEDGEPVSGSLDELIFEISLGHRVRFQYDTTVLEANSIRITEQTVIAQSLEEMKRRGGSGADKYFFNTETMWQWTTVHTTGTVKIHTYRVRDMSLFTRQNSMRSQIRWMVDTRPWKRVYSTPPGPYSTVEQLVEAVKRGASVRFNLQQDFSAGFFFTNADNVRLASSVDYGDVVYAQCLRHISDKKDPTNSKEYEIQMNPFHWFLMISSEGVMAMSAWRMQSRDQLYDSVAPQANITWFVSE